MTVGNKLETAGYTNLNISCIATLFISDARSFYGVTSVSSVESKYKWLVPLKSKLEYLTITRYNFDKNLSKSPGVKKSLEIFDAVQLEIDWWWNTVSTSPPYITPSPPGFDEYYGSEVTINSYIKSKKYDLINEAYFSHYAKNTSWQGYSESEQADKLLPLMDRYLMVEATTTPNFAYLNTWGQLDYLANAAQKASKVVDVIFIFYCNGGKYMFDYFDIKKKNNPFDRAYYDLISQYQAGLAAGTINKTIDSNINFIGYCIYDYDGASLARP